MTSKARKAPKSQLIYSINLNTYNDKSIAAGYTMLDALQPPERVILEQLRPHIENGKMLDIGVGGGRTTRFLLALSNDYTGIDYSHEMIERCREKYPDVKLIQCDARDLSMFPDGSFDFILFSFNGIDMVCHEDRLRILRETHRVLKVGGYFVFSSHNKERTYYTDVRKVRFTFTRHPVNLAKALAKYAFDHLNRWRNQKHEVHEEDYSILNDRAHNFRLLNYYITIPKQLEQLRDCGFLGPVQAYDKDGIKVENDRHSAWIYYCTQKCPAASHLPDCPGGGRP